ncbi:MAG: helix-turn-helix domain-containing protein [Chloroflexi bacterium]|nr:MAG: helix-turn-helix domain-containing protein [Chloroflexota bacterium]
MITNETEYATISEAARLLRVSVPTVWRWIDSGQLPAHRIGKRSIRIRREDLAAVIRPARDQTMKEVKEQDLQITHLGRRPVDVENLIGSLREGQERILARRKGKRFRSSVSLIREGRDERSAAL